jgi:hypothetical protein
MMRTSGKKQVLRDAHDDKESKLLSDNNLDQK